MKLDRLAIECIENKFLRLPNVQKYEIKEKNTGKIIGKVPIDKGIGNFIKKFQSMSASDEMYINIISDRLYLKDVEGFIIQLNGNEYLSVPVKFEREKKEEQSVILNKTNEDMHTRTNNNEVLNKQESDENEKIGEKGARAASENVLIEGIEVEDKTLKMIEPIHEDKWKQLCKKYPNVHPFPNRKVFLSIKPENFIILQQEYQKLVHNSFLLHGFYNYGHMILGKLSEEEETPMYVGVPGVYYEQEKRAAQMFGFVGFESTEHPVQAGSYGYYMIEVEI